MDANQICNGPLKPGTSYRFKIRLYTSPNMFSDSLYSDIVVTGMLKLHSRNKMSCLHKISAHKFPLLSNSGDNSYEHAHTKSKQKTAGHAWTFFTSGATTEPASSLHFFPLLALFCPINKPQQNAHEREK